MGLPEASTSAWLQYPRVALSVVDRAIRRLVVAAFGISALAMLAIMLIGSADVIGSGLFLSPVPAATEAQEVLLAISIFLAVGHAQYGRQHIAVDIVVQHLPRALRRALLLISLALGAMVCGIIAMQAWAQAISSWQTREAANAIITFPIYPAKFLVSLGAWIAALEFARQWFLVVSGRDAVQGDSQPISTH